MTPEPPIRLFREAMGLSPLPERLRQARVALRGEQDVPPSTYDLTSLSQLRPRIGLRLWRGRPYIPRTVLISNLFNHRQTPISAGWSVKKTQVEDFRGRDLTYDSHNGTDFAIPVGTAVVTAAPGVVVRRVSEFNRGGLKLFIDHGRGLMTCYAHLARSLVDVGDRVGRGQPIAWSGYSGLDSLVTFPWGVPHVHFNVWLDAEPVDPFGHGGEPSMWRGGDLPTPATDDADPIEVSDYDPARVELAIDACRTAASRARIRAFDDLPSRAAELIAEMNYYPTRFTARVRPYREAHGREARLDLPFRAEDFDEVRFIDDIG